MKHVFKLRQDFSPCRFLVDSEQKHVQQRFAFMFICQRVENYKLWILFIVTMNSVIEIGLCIAEMKLNLIPNRAHAGVTHRPRFAGRTTTSCAQYVQIAGTFIKTIDVREHSHLQ